MGISVEEAIHELRNREEVFVAYSQATRLPYVTCDEETFNDQARIFATEEEIKEYGKQLLEDKILLMGMKYEKKDYPRLYGTLYAIGVNSVIWIDGEEKIEIAVTGGGEDSMQLNTATSGYLNGISALRHLYEGLYKLDANGEIVLGQAASAETSEDKLTWTFTLRDDITWSDGQPVTAGDFVFGFDNLAAQGGDYSTIL